MLPTHQYAYKYTAAVRIRSQIDQIRIRSEIDQIRIQSSRKPDPESTLSKTGSGSDPLEKSDPIIRPDKIYYVLFSSNKKVNQIQLFLLIIIITYYYFGQ